MQHPLSVIILAAGRSTRFRSDTPKILHPLCGRSMVGMLVRSVLALRPTQLVVVVNPQTIDAVRTQLTHELGSAAKNLRYAVQREQRGTADAVRAGLLSLPASAGSVLILNADSPQITAPTLRAFLAAVAAQGGLGGVIASTPPDPTGLGRVLRAADGGVARIVEERDADADTRAIREINTGVFSVERAWLTQQLTRIQNHNAQRELYLPDIAQFAADAGKPLLAWPAPDASEFLGINTRAELADVERVLRARINHAWMVQGVTMRDPASVAIDCDVTLAADVVLGPNVTITGASRIAEKVCIEQGCVIHASTIGAGTQCKPYCVIDGARIAPTCVVGPFARLRPDTRLDDGVHVGNFVEVKKSHLKRGVKANHLTYLGDAIVGARTNVGCGTITCNYDGLKKHATLIGDDCFIGSDVALVAPVKIGRNSLIAAGSVVTENSPPDSLVIARSRQVVKKNWRRRAVQLASTKNTRLKKVAKRVKK